MSIVVKSKEKLDSKKVSKVKSGLKNGSKYDKLVPKINEDQKMIESIKNNFPKLKIINDN